VNAIRCFITLGLGIVLFEFAGCTRDQQPNQHPLPIEKTRPLPEVPANDTHFSTYKPANPYEELRPGVLARTIFEAAGPPGYRIEVQDLRVDAKAKGEDIRLPGAAFLEVQDGTGIVTTGAKRQEVSPGAMIAVSAGQAFAAEATSDRPLAIRVRVIKAE
jgi:quercetin dioxygenase-like cupin family protein